MAEEITVAMNKFVLSKEEEDGVSLDGSEMGRGLEDCSKSLIGMIYGDRVVNYTGVKNYVMTVWRITATIKIVELGKNMFQFIFGLEDDRKKVLGGGPWVYDSQPLILRAWQKDIEKEEKNFRSTQIWVQIWKLPLHWVSKEVGRKIGMVFMEVKDIFIPESGSKEGRHIKILVEIDITKPLPRGTKVRMNGEVKWIEFRYEKCPEFCYYCGRVGHNYKSCGRKTDVQQEEESHQYGPWMKCGTVKSPTKRSPGRRNEQQQHEQRIVRWELSKGRNRELAEERAQEGGEIGNKEGEENLSRNPGKNKGMEIRAEETLEIEGEVGRGTEREVEQKDIQGE